MNCPYCGKPSENEYCSLHCQQSYYDYLVRFKQFKPFYLLGITVSIIIFIVPALFLGIHMHFIGIGMLILGATFATLPFAPSSIISKFGTKKTEKVLRIAGYTVAIIGLILMFVALYI